MEPQQKIETALKNIRKLIEAIKFIIKLPEEETGESRNWSTEYFADIEDIMSESRLTLFWNKCKPKELPELEGIAQEEIEREGYYRKGFFANFVRKSTLDYDHEFFKSHLKVLENELEHISEMSAAYFSEDGGSFGKTSLKEDLAAALRESLHTNADILGWVMEYLGKYAVADVSEIPAFEIELDKRRSRSFEQSVRGKNDRIDCRKDVLQALGYEIKDNLVRIRDTIGIEPTATRTVVGGVSTR